MQIAETERLILPYFRMTDGDALNRVLGDAEVMRFSSDVKSPLIVREWLRQ
jgi:RimJ/RimL family protein N-acetyltransferase